MNLALAFIGLVATVSTLGVGMYWIVTSLTFAKVPNRYTYDGDNVIDNEEDAKE